MVFDVRLDGHLTLKQAIQMASNNITNSVAVEEILPTLVASVPVKKERRKLTNYVIVPSVSELRPDEEVPLVRTKKTKKSKTAVVEEIIPDPEDTLLADIPVKTKSKTDVVEEIIPDPEDTLLADIIVVKTKSKTAVVEEIIPDPEDTLLSAIVVKKSKTKTEVKKSSQPPIDKKDIREWCRKNYGKTWFDRADKAQLMADAKEALTSEKNEVRCVLCDTNPLGAYGGNNALPLAKGYCCDECNWNLVCPARMMASAK